MTLRILDAEIVLSGPPELEAPWRVLWAPFIVDAVADSSPVVEVRREPWGYSLSSPGRDINVTDVWRALVESRNDAVRLALQGTTGILDLHGAVLVRDGLALLLLGDAWAGKTTLALALVDAGWHYFSDDVVVIELASGLLRPLPKPPGVKARTWQEMRRHWDPVPHDLGAPPGPFVIPPPFYGSLTDRGRPAWLLFLNYDEAAEPGLESLTAGRALARAGEHLGKADAVTFSALAGVVGQCHCAVLTYAETAEALEMVQGIVI